MIDHFSKGADDIVLPFAVEALDVRGRVVRLGDAVDTLVARHGYPDAVARVVGEAAALTALLGSALKFDGRFQLQTKTDGPIEMLVVDYDAPDRLRAFARFDAERVAQATGEPRPAEASALVGRLLGTGHLAMTIDQGPQMSRYQGIVALEGQGLEEAAHQYFRQSEQIPTRIRLAVAEEIAGGAAPSYRAGGLMVQFLPVSPERQRQADFPAGDVPEGHVARDATFSEDDAWVEAKALVDTIEDHELIDPALSSERLLFRLFHERGVRVFEPQGIREACRCSRERVVTVLSRFTPQERRDMIADDGTIQVTCEFCSRAYAFAPDEVERAAQADEDEA